MSYFQIDWIVDYLKATSTVHTFVEDRIFYWEPMREQTKDYIVINQVSQIIETTVSKQALIEIRIISWDENTRKKTLLSILDSVTNSLVLTPTNATYTLWTQTVYKIVEAWWFDLLVDDKNRNVLIKDYVFYFLS